MPGFYCFSIIRNAIYSLGKKVLVPPYAAMGILDLESCKKVFGQQADLDCSEMFRVQIRKIKTA